MPLVALPHCMIGWSPASFAFWQQRLELGERLGRLGHADLGGQLLVVEHAGHAVVEARRVQRAVAALAVRVDAVLHQLAGGHLSQP